MKQKQIMTADSGMFEAIQNIMPLPDDWNGGRWLLFRAIGSEDEKKVKDIFNSYKKNNILCSFNTITIPKTFFAELNGVMTEYKKGKRLLVDENRRYKAALIAIEKGYEIITPNGEKYKLPITDLTPPVEGARGKLTEFEGEGKEIIFKQLQILNTLQEPFTDEQIIIGGAECAHDPKRKKTFIYIKEKLKMYYTDLTVKLILKCILGRDKLNITEKRNVEINFDMADKAIADINLKTAYSIKKEMGGIAPVPFLNALFTLVKQWRNEGYFLSQEKYLNNSNKTGSPTISWEVDKSTIKTDCYTLSDPIDIRLYKKYMGSIAGYINGTWKKFLIKKKTSLTGNVAQAKRDIQERVVEMWEEHKTK